MQQPPPADQRSPHLVRIEQLGVGSALLGVELDERYRVLAVTLEPPASTGRDGNTRDRRLQLLCHPVSSIRVTAARLAGDAPEVLRFEMSQLLDIIAALDAPPLERLVFDRPQPPPGQRLPTSLQGASSAPDGVHHSLQLSARSSDLLFELFARFDTAEVRDAEGHRVVDPADLS